MISRISATIVGFSLMNSSSDRARLESTSKEEQMTPPLFAELSLMMITPIFFNERRAQGLRYKLAPSTIAVERALDLFDVFRGNARMVDIFNFRVGIVKIEIHQIW